MSKKKPATQTSTSTSTTVNNPVQWSTPPMTPQTQAAIDAANAAKGRATPIIRGHYAGRRRDVGGQFNNPIGSHTTAAIRDASNKAQNEELDQEEGLALAANEYNEGTADFQRQLQIAGLTSPQAMNMGGTTTTNSSSTATPASGGVGGILKTVAGIAVPIAVGALTMGAGAPAAGAAIM